MSGLTLQNIHKFFPGKPALQGVSFEVKESEIVAVLGPSGCGKSTLLSIVAGLLQPDAGQVLWNGSSLSRVPPYQRDFGLMFQDFALFPHRDVYKNVAFGLEMKRLPASAIEARVSETLTLVGLPGFTRRDTNTLSGGEAQRVALARSLAPRPRLLMLDEPLGSLDRTLRERLVIDLRPILRSSRQTAVYVTHDQEEAFVIADRVVVMNEGQVEQIGTPPEIYGHPASVFVARFLGMNNLLEGEIHTTSQGKMVKTEIGELAMGAVPVPRQVKIDAPVLSSPQERPPKVWVLLRPDAVRAGATGSQHLAGLVKERSFRGNTTRLTLAIGQHNLVFDFPSTVDLPNAGQRFELSFDPENAVQIFYRQ